MRERRCKKYFFSSHLWFKPQAVANALRTIIRQQLVAKLSHSYLEFTNEIDMCTRALGKAI